MLGTIKSLIGVVPDPVAIPGLTVIERVARDDVPERKHFLTG